MYHQPPDIFTPPASPNVNAEHIQKDDKAITSTPKLMANSTSASKKRKRDMPSDINELLLDSVKRDLNNVSPPHMHKVEELDADNLFFLSLVEVF